MSDQVRVSFAVPCYNYGRFVSQAIDSLLGQTFQSLEIIVIDDASTDETPEILEQYRGNPRVRLVRHERNLGHVASYNEGLALARGDLVGVFDADDFCLSPDAVARQVAVFDSHPNVGMVYTAHALVQDDHISSQAIPWPEDFARSGLDEFRNLVWSNYIEHSGTLLRRDLRQELGPFLPDLSHPLDWDVWLRASAKRDVGYLAQPLYAYRLHDANRSHRLVRPWDATDQLIVALERAYDALPDTAPPDMLADREAVLRHALLQTAWVDLFHGRRTRAWQGVAHALRRRPELALTSEPWRFTARLLTMTAVGRDRFRRAHDWIDVFRRRRPFGLRAGV